MCNYTNLGSNKIISNISCCGLHAIYKDIH